MARRKEDQECWKPRCGQPIERWGLCLLHFKEWKAAIPYRDPISLRSSAHDRFWHSTENRGPDQCWQWNYMLSSSGYGFFVVEENGRHKQIRAALYAYETMRQEIPEGRRPVNFCGFPPCVNPWHWDITCRRCAKRYTEEKCEHCASRKKTALITDEEKKSKIRQARVTQEKRDNDPRWAAVNPSPVCFVDKCYRIRSTYGMCAPHFEEWITPRPLKRMYASGKIDIWSYVERGTDEECWDWMGHLNSFGVPICYEANDDSGATVMAHRKIYELITGEEIADNLFLQRHCALYTCVNPSHRAPRCPNGHLLDRANTLPVTNPKKGVAGRCRTCAS